MTKRKKSATSAGPSYHPSFQLPTKEQRSAALGSFPGAVHVTSSREAMLFGVEDNDTTARLSSIRKEEADDLNNPALYRPMGRSVTSHAVPQPVDEQDWLVNVPEEGQTFDEYIRFLTLRSGRLRPIANAAGVEIVLLPIVVDGQRGNSTWDSGAGPPLEQLVALTRAYFDRPVRLLEPATLLSPSSTNVPKRQTKKPQQSGAVQRSTFEIRMPTSHDGTTLYYGVVGRTHNPSGRTQYSVDSLLSVLTGYREGQAFHSDKNFCIMALTMQDLYDGPTDLFVSGMAAGGSKVAVFSFGRYHPHIKMHPGHWYDYGYGTQADMYSYYEDEENSGKKRKKKKSTPSLYLNEPPAFQDLKQTSKSEYWRRCGKVVVHELGHLYGLDHCIFNCCLMNGTGHLVEDFAAPFHLCPVCLRKLQWRLGFGVSRRYEALAEAFRAMGHASEASWTERQAVALAKNVA